jgi:hypothetical protein
MLPLYRVFSNDHGPFLDSPVRDESTGHVGIVLDESLDVAPIVGEKNEQRPGRLQGARKHKAAVRIRLIDHGEVCLPERLASFDEVVDSIVEKREIWHDRS